MPELTEAVAEWLFAYSLKHDWLAERPAWAELDEAMRAEWHRDAAELLRLAASEGGPLPGPPDPWAGQGMDRGSLG